MDAWCVAKTGFVMFDALHAYGLALLLATIGGMPIDVQDHGPMYHLSSPWKLFVAPSLDIFDVLFTLPTSEELLPSFPQSKRDILPFATLDGLLTVLFTTRGERILSISDLRRKQRSNGDVVQQVLHKVTTATRQWKRYASRISSHASDWLNDVLRDYAVASPTIPVPRGVRKGKDLTAVLTLDPSLGYSTRQPTSDGQVHRKINLALHGARYATLLAYLGATRFLRAQRVAGNLVNCYVPLVSTILIDACMTLTSLDAAECSPHQALMRYLLFLLDAHEAISRSSQGPQKHCQAYRCARAQWTTQQAREPVWRGLAYQTLQTQGIQQSFSLAWGALECDWIIELARLSGGTIIRFWRQWLDPRSSKRLDEQEHLIDSLFSCRAQTWMSHLCDVARHNYIQQDQSLRLYSREEVQHMTASSCSPLSTILEREEGTLRFGRALRQLGQYNPSILRDLLEMLDTARTLDQLLRALHSAMQQCLLAKAKYPFIRIPSHHDLALLITDAQQYSVQTVACLLMVLSALRFAYRDIDKYEVHTLIGLLLALTKQEPLQVDTLVESPETIPSTLFPDPDSFPFEEGGPGL